jgi:hypothetical protein
MKILGKVIHGSKLYGLDGPNSDTDYKQFFQPKLEDLILMRADKNQRSENEEENTELEGFAVQIFGKLLCNAEDIVIAMLHVPADKIIIDSLFFKQLRDNKEKFYTKKMAGMTGYCKGQVEKYSLRADRMLAVSKVLEILNKGIEEGKSRIYQLYDELPNINHCFKGVEERNNNVDKRYFECAGKKVTATVALEYAKEIYQNLYDNYGDRVRIAASLDSQDYKAISHSFRVAYQLRSIYSNGTYSYPLVETPFIKAVKYQHFKYLDNDLDAKLNELIAEVEELAKNSKFPDKVDKKWYDDLILGLYN